MNAKEAKDKIRENNLSKVRASIEFAVQHERTSMQDYLFSETIEVLRSEGYHVKQGGYDVNNGERFLCFISWKT